MPRFNPDNWPHNLRLVDQHAALARESGVTPAQLALRWVLEQGECCHVIPGTTNVLHLEENFHASELDIPADAIAEAGRIINHDTVRGHRYHDAIRPTIDTEEFEDA
jgi:aryl-alcohol dehydrogenase-like predicted oxidoreductase